MYHFPIFQNAFINIQQSLFILSKLESKKDTLNFSEVFAEIEKQPLNLSDSWLLSLVAMAPLVSTGCSDADLYILNSSCDLDFELWVN